MDRERHENRTICSDIRFKALAVSDIDYHLYDTSRSTASSRTAASILLSTLFSP